MTQERIDQLEAEAAAMRKALEEASDAIGELGDDRLAEETGNTDWRGLSDRIETALSGGAGRPLLERLRNAEAELENGHKALDAADAPRADEHDALYSVAGRVARLRQERDEARAALEAVHRSQLMILGNVPREER